MYAHIKCTNCKNEYDQVNWKMGNCCGACGSSHVVVNQTMGVPLVDTPQPPDSAEKLISTIRKSEAIREASLKLLRASDSAAAAVLAMGGIRYEAITDGMHREIVRQMRRLNDIARELNQMADAIEWDVDATKTIAIQIKNDEEVN